MLTLSPIPTPHLANNHTVRLVMWQWLIIRPTAGSVIPVYLLWTQKLMWAWPVLN